MTTMTTDTKKRLNRALTKKSSADEIQTKMDLSQFAITAAGTMATVGGSAAETITIAGLLATDIAMVTLKTKGATPRTILAAAAAAGQINVTMSGDATTDHVLAYMVMRAA